MTEQINTIFFVTTQLVLKSETLHRCAKYGPLVSLSQKEPHYPRCTGACTLRSHLPDETRGRRWKLLCGPNEQWRGELQVRVSTPQGQRSKVRASEEGEATKSTEEEQRRCYKTLTGLRGLGYNKLFVHYSDGFVSTTLTGVWCCYCACDVESDRCNVETGGDQHSRVAVGLLVVTFVVLHVEGHLTNLAVETSFMPVLKTTHTHTSMLDTMRLWK